MKIRATFTVIKRHQILPAAKRLCNLLGSFTTVLWPRPFYASSEATETGLQLPKRLSGSGRRSTQARAVSGRDARGARLKRE